MITPRTCCHLLPFPPVSCTSVYLNTWCTQRLGALYTASSVIHSEAAVATAAARVIIGWRRQVRLRGKEGKGRDACRSGPQSTCREEIKSGIERKKRTGYGQRSGSTTEWEEAERAGNKSKRPKTTNELAKRMIRKKRKR